MRNGMALVFAVTTVLASPAAAETEKEESCRLQADVVVAIQQARLDRVRERRVEQAVRDTSPTWPEQYYNLIPIVTPWVYELPMEQVRENDLGEVWNAACLTAP